MDLSKFFKEFFNSFEVKKKYLKNKLFLRNSVNFLFMSFNLNLDEFLEKNTFRFCADFSGKGIFY